MKICLRRQIADKFLILYCRTVKKQREILSVQYNNNTLTISAAEKYEWNSTVCEFVNALNYIDCVHDSWLHCYYYHFGFLPFFSFSFFLLLPLVAIVVKNIILFFSNTLALTLLVTPDKQRIWKRNDDEYKDDRNQHERNILIYIFFPSSLSLSSSSSSVILCAQQRKSRTNISKSDYNHTYTHIHARAAYAKE